MLKQPKQNKFQAFLNKYSKHLIVAAILLVIFHQYIVMIIVCLLLGYLGLVTIKVSRVVPHISIETMTSSSILVGYIWGWKIGFIFAMVTGLVGYANISLLKHTTILTTLWAGACAVLADLFKGMGYSFGWAFLLSYAIRIVIGFFMFMPLNPDMLENFMHSYGDGIFSILVTFQFMNIIYTLVTMITPV